MLWIGRLVSQIGDKFYAIALAWWVLQKTNSPIAMGLLMVASALPGLLIAPLAGALIDRWNRKPVIIIADIVRGVFVIAIVGLSVMNLLEVWHVFFVAVIISLGSSFYDPTVQAVIPQIVSKEQLPKANSLSQIIGGISTVLGPMLGAVAVSFLGFTTVFLLNGLSYLVSAFCGWLMTIPTATKRSMANRIAWDDIKAGIDFLVRQKRIMIIIGVIGTAHFFIGSLMVSLPFLAKELAGNGVQNLGYLQTMMGLGLILGSLYISLKRKNGIRDSYLFLFMIGIGICYLLIGVFKMMTIVALIPYLILMMLIGIAIANASIYWQSLLQTNTPNEMAGRIFSISTMMGNLSLPLAFGLFGVLLKFCPMKSLLIFSGIALVITSSALLVSYRQSIE
jgi:MFS transporter, DHA3 family, macrolide efflux protein